MATQNLKFYKKASTTAVPTDGMTAGDVYFMEGKGIYVATSATAASQFSYANDASTSVKGVVQLSSATNSNSTTLAATASAVKSAYDRGSLGVTNAATAQSTADNAAAAAATAQNTANSRLKNASVSGSTLTITKGDDTTVTFTDTNTHNSHGHTFTANAASSTTGIDTSVDVVSALGDASSTTGSLSSTYDKVSVPTLKVTNSLSSRISTLETAHTTGMQYKGTTAAVPSSGKQGDVWKVSGTANSAGISTLGAEEGDFIVCKSATVGSTAATWDVWQANVNKDAYWDTNVPASGKIVVADGTNGKIKTIDYNASSFAAASHNQASSTITAMTSYAKASTEASITTSDSLNTAIGKLEFKLDTVISSDGGKVNKATISSSGTKGETSTRTLAHGGSFKVPQITTNGSGLTTAITEYTLTLPAAYVHPTSHNADFITMTSYAKSSATGANLNLATTDTVLAALGKLEKKADDAASTAAGKWTETNATTTTKGIASFSASNFTVSNGAVSLVWADFA